MKAVNELRGALVRQVWLCTGACKHQRVCNSVSFLMHVFFVFIGHNARMPCLNGKCSFPLSYKSVLFAPLYSRFWCSEYNLRLFIHVRFQGSIICIRIVWNAEIDSNIWTGVRFVSDLHNSLEQSFPLIYASDKIVVLFLALENLKQTIWTCRLLQSCLLICSRKDNSTGFSANVSYLIDMS